MRYGLDNCDQRFELVNWFDDCKSFGRGICESDEDEKKHLDFCVRLSLSENATNGFFIAVFHKINNK